MPGNSTNLVIGAVNLDRGQLGAGVFQLLRLRQLLWIKYPAPRRKSPTADADIDIASIFRIAMRALGHASLSLAIGERDIKDRDIED